MEGAESYPDGLSRHFVNVAGREVHYLRSGSGPVAVLLAAFPWSAGSLAPLAQALADEFSVVVPDLPGYGNSHPLDTTRDSTVGSALNTPGDDNPPPLDTTRGGTVASALNTPGNTGGGTGAGLPTLGDYAEAVVATLDALGIDRCHLYGLGSGAQLALEVAVRRPGRVANLVLDGLPLLDDAERAELAENFCPRFDPSWDGAHLAAIWWWCREQSLFRPWFRPSAATRLDHDEPPPDVLARRATDVLRAGPGYAAGLQAAFAHPTAEALARCPVPYTLTTSSESDDPVDSSSGHGPGVAGARESGWAVDPARQDDSQFPDWHPDPGSGRGHDPGPAHAEGSRTPSRPATEFGRGSECEPAHEEGRAQPLQTLIGAGSGADSSLQPPPVVPTPGAIARSYVRIRGGRHVLVRRVAGAGAGAETGGGPPLVMLHASPTSSALLEPLMRALGAGGRRTVFALDTAGNGDSDPPTRFPAPGRRLDESQQQTAFAADPPVPTAAPGHSLGESEQEDADVGDPAAGDGRHFEIADFAAIVGEVLAQLGLGHQGQEFDLYGTHTGALIAMELAIVNPGVRRLILEGVTLFDDGERPDLPARSELLADYLPSFEPRWDGSHLFAAWHFRRSFTLYWPWYRRTRAGIRWVPPADLNRFQRSFVEFAKRLDSYRLPYRAALAYRTAERLAHLRVPTLVAGHPDDPLHTHSAEAAGLITGAPATTVTLPDDTTDVAAIYDDFLRSPQPPAGDAAQPAREVAAAKVSARSFPV